MSTAHADTQTQPALRHASCDAADCCVIAQHTQTPAIAAANTIANHQVEANQAISCASTVLPFAAAAAQTQQIVRLHALMQHRKPLEHQCNSSARWHGPSAMTTSGNMPFHAACLQMPGHKLARHATEEGELLRA